MLLLVVVGMIGMIWITSNHVIVNFHLYPKNVQALDLRHEEISSEDYEDLQRSLPDCHILWNVEFQDSLYSSDSVELTVSSLTDTDMAQLQYFPNLKGIDARQCTDIEPVLRLMETYPELTVRYQVPVNGQMYPDITQELTLSAVNTEDLALLPKLPYLKYVTLSDISDIAAAKALQDYCQEYGISFSFVMGEETYSTKTVELTLTDAAEEQLLILELLPNLKKLHLTQPSVPAERLLALRDSGVNVTWETTICGQTFSDTATDIDLSEATVASIEEVELGMTYLPNAKTLFLGFCGLDNDELAAYRERSRDRYKVVWVVDLSGKMQVRTDIDNFMPSRDGWGYVRDHEVDNIRYCEDLICIDLGHMGIKDTSFLEPLVNLEYLILAHTEITNVNGLTNHKKLKYLELDWSPVRDLSALINCTALEDLNIGNSWPDVTPLLQMPWLKNVYMILGSQRDAWRISQACPDTRVVASGKYTVSSGWRQLPNYYAMRDILGMHYM